MGKRIQRAFCLALFLAGPARDGTASGAVTRPLFAAAAALLAACCPACAAPAPRPDAPHPAATWPWPGAKKETPHPGVTHWLARSSPDGTILELLEFDFGANPKLRLELYDQDEDDPTPFDNNVRYWARGVGQATRHLTEAGRGKVIAAWNGLFFDSARAGGAGHVAPVVLNGKAHFFVGNHRWAFGVQYRDGRPTFKTIHLPDRATLEREFTFAACSAQCLVREGRPLRLRPYPKPGEPPAPRPVRSTPEEAGHIPGIDAIRTSRTSMGWSRDGRRFSLLIVKEPDEERASFAPLQRRQAEFGGWMLSDLQRFWQARKVWGAVNIDGGDVTQLTLLRPDGKYDLVPPRWANPAMRLTFGPDFRGAPQGGTMMYFYVRDAEPTAKR